MSKQDLSEDTEVVLLLCGRFGGEKQEPHPPLAPREYGELAKWLMALSLRPSDLLSNAGRDALSSLQGARLERTRVEFLLGRGTAMALALERWARGGLWVMSRGEAEYPKRLKRQLKNAAPPLLYGAGDKSLLDRGGLAIIGSRDATESGLAYTHAIAARCAREGLAVVSGGARGVDAAAMQGATEAGGQCIGVLANDLLKTSVNRQNRIGLQQGQLVLISPFFPEAGFNAGNAMGRNRYIYALADQALVIDSALRSGGTWEGAVENLKNRWVPLYVRTPGEGPGNAALVSEGAFPFNLAADSADSLVEFFGAQTVTGPAATDAATETQMSLLAPTPEPRASAPVAQEPLLLQRDGDPAPDTTEPQAMKHESHVAIENEAVADAGNTATPDPVLAEAVEPPERADAAVESSSLDMYTDFSTRLSQLLAVEALPEESIAASLGLEKSQAKAWLKRAGEAGLVDKLKKPVRYALAAKP